MPLSLLDMFWMKLRRTPIGPIREALRIVEENRLPFDLGHLEAVSMAGRSPLALAQAALLARRAGLPDEPERLTEAAMGDEDLEAFVSRRYRIERQAKQDDLRHKVASDRIARSELISLLEEDLRDLQQSVKAVNDMKLDNHVRANVVTQLEAKMSPITSELRFLRDH